MGFAIASFSDISNCTLPGPAACYGFGRLRTFAQLRSLDDFSQWVMDVLLRSRVVTGQSRDVQLLGAMRVRQVRVTIQAHAAASGAHLPDRFVVFDVAPRNVNAQR